MSSVIRGEINIKESETNDVLDMKIKCDVQWNQ